MHDNILFIIISIIKYDHHYHHCVNVLFIIHNLEEKKRAHQCHSRKCFSYFHKTITNSNNLLKRYCPWCELWRLCFQFHLGNLHISYYTWCIFWWTILWFNLKVSHKYPFTVIHFSQTHFWWMDHELKLLSSSSILLKYVKYYIDHIWQRKPIDFYLDSFLFPAKFKVRFQLAQAGQTMHCSHLV